MIVPTIFFLSLLLLVAVSMVVVFWVTLTRTNNSIAAESVPCTAAIRVPVRTTQVPEEKWCMAV